MCTVYCDERPEHSSALPWRRTRITCTSSSRPDQPHLELVYPRLDKPWETRKEGETILLWAGELTCGLLLSFQKPACDGSCPAWSTDDPPSTGTHGGEHLSTATTSPSLLHSILWINPPSGVFIELSLSCDPSTSLQYVYYSYIKTHTYSIYFENISMYIFIFIYFILYKCT